MNKTYTFESYFPPVSQTLVLYLRYITFFSVFLTKPSPNKLMNYTKQKSMNTTHYPALTYHHTVL